MWSFSFLLSLFSPRSLAFTIARYSNVSTHFMCFVHFNAWRICSDYAQCGICCLRRICLSVRLTVTLVYFIEMAGPIINQVTPCSRWSPADFVVPEILVFLQRAQCSHCKRCISYGNSVCPSVCLSVTRRYCVKTAARSTVQFAPLDSKICLVL